MLTPMLIVATLMAPAQDVQGRRFVLEGNGAVQFEVATTAGVVRGEIPISKLESRGLEGWGRFDLRIVLAPDAVKTGDAVRDAFISNAVLKANEGGLFVASTDRKPPAARAGQGQTPEDEMWAVGAWLDPRRGRGYFPFHYRFTIDETNQHGKLEVTRSATLKELGLDAIPHPFVQVTGPVKLRMVVDLVRS